jgi:protease-4
MSDNTGDFPPPAFTPSHDPLPPAPKAHPAKKKGLSPLGWVLTLSATFFVLFLIISGAVFMMRSPSSGTARSGASGLLAGAGSGSVGVVELNGVIMDSKRFLKQLDRMEEDDDVKAVVVRINSPGGAVGPSQEIYDAVKRFKKPLVSSMGSVAASGGFYVAMGTSKVFANPGTITGSIGVIMEFANLEKLYEWAKIRRYVIKTGKFKDAGSEYREMTPEERALLQTMIDDVLSQFKQAVADGRKQSMDQVTAIADGRIFSGAQAKKLKLIDELGGLHEAVNEAAKMAGIKGKPDVVYPPKARGRLMDLILDNASDEAGAEGSSGGSPTLVERVLRGFLRGEAIDSTVTSPGVYWLWRGAV